MRLGLLGYPVNHSKSPELYQKFLGDELTSYQLFSCPTEDDIPSLSVFSKGLDGLNITSPYKRFFVPDIEIPSPLVRSLGAVNTLAFVNGQTFGTNTDLIAVVEILKNYKKKYGELQIFLLGDGVMATVTKLVAKDMGIPLMQFSRKTEGDLQNIDLTTYQDKTQPLIINSCSREFVFDGKVSGREIFWDYNYSFLPHQNTLPSRVLVYQDGQEMLELQAKAAINFWREVNPKLK